MDTLQAPKQKALKHYADGDAEQKNLLEDLFGQKAFLPSNMDEVFTTKGTTREAFYQKFNGFDDDTIAYEEAKLIADALNGGTKLRTADTTQYKYSPYFKVIPDSSKPAGFALSSYGYDFSLAYAGLGARLRLKSPELARYAGETFTSVYERLCP